MSFLGIFSVQIFWNCFVVKLSRLNFCTRSLIQIILLPLISMIQLQSVNKSYPMGKGSLHVLKGIDLNIAAGEMVSIMGSSGSGKSTLLNILGILDNYDSGSYTLDNTLIKDLNPTKAVYIVAGKMIQKGDVIAKIRIIPNMISLNEAESRVNRSKINLDQAQTDFDRYQSLFKDKIISPSEFQQYEIRLRQAREESTTSQDNLDLIKEGVAKSTGKTTNTLIRSTLSGMVLDVPVKEGFSVIEANTFNEGTTVASIADMGEMIFEGKVDESEVGKIHQGMDLILTVGAIENYKFNAKLEYIAPKGVAENGAIQFQIRAAVVIDTSYFLRAGYSANADIILDRRDSVLGVPESVLQFSKDTTWVEVKTSAVEFKKQIIKTGISDGINIEVLEGLNKNVEIKIPAGIEAEK
jgi:HlyD family secretion protein